MLYTHSIPVTIWQKAISWKAYNFNASVISDISSDNGSRIVQVDLGYQREELGYVPHINDILLPIGNEQATFATRSNQPYFWSGVNEDWDNRPMPLFLTAFNDSAVQFSDFLSLPEYHLLAPSTYNLQNVWAVAAKTVWNRLIQGHPILREAHAAQTGSEIVSNAIVKYEEATPVKLSELTEQMAAAVDYRKLGGFRYVYSGDKQPDFSGFGWYAGQEFNSLYIDARKEDVSQIEIRSRESADNPNVMVAYTKDGQTQYVHYAANGDALWEAPAYRSTYGWRLVFENTETLENGETLPKANQVLASSPYVDSWDVSLVINMASRYQVEYSEVQEGTWTLPAPKLPIDVYGLLPDPSKSLRLPVKAYDFATGELLLATNNDITLGGSL